jgi:predicted ATPase
MMMEGFQATAAKPSVAADQEFHPVAGLVEKSLIATRIDETQAQYRLLYTTRAHALEKLEEHAEVDVVLRGHAEYVAGYLESQRVAPLALVRPKEPQPIPVH